MSNRAESLLRRAQRHGDRTAILFGDRRISFAELGDLACETAGGLRLLGISAGTRVVNRTFSFADSRARSFMATSRVSRCNCVGGDVTSPISPATPFTRS